jgi:DNA helicase-2/ATP-dependent DNA helicase PcrA
VNGLPPDVPGSASADSDVEALAPPSAAALPAPEAISDDLPVDLPDEDVDQDVDQDEVEALADGPAIFGAFPGPGAAAPGPAARATHAPSRTGTGLNPAQTQAVQAPIGPLLVLAGAGTGKTRVVIARMAHLVWRGSRPSRILAVTFTNKAAREMMARAKAYLKPKKVPRGPGGKPQEDLPEISTIHSLCVRILRRHAPRLGYPERFAIIDRGEQEATARKVLKELKVPDTTLSPGDLVDRVSRWKSAAVRPDGAIETLSADAPEHWTLAAAGYRRYQHDLRVAGAVDFDDLLMLVEELFDKHEDVRLAEAGRFDHVLVDEYQDTSGIQERILSALARDHRSLCVVGDDDQSIYAWRGAQISHILEFPARWPKTVTVRLEENYRSTPEIIHAANTLIACNSRRHGKTLVSKAPSGPAPAIVQAQDELDEARRIVGDVEARFAEGSVDPPEAVILLRTGEQTRVFEQELRRRNIPYELVGSRSFFDRREVKDVMAFLRMMVDPDDDMALSRIANVPPRGLSSSAVLQARTAAQSAGRSLWRELLGRRSDGTLSNAAAGGLTALEKLITLGGGEAPLQPAVAIRALLDQAGYRAFLEREYEDVEELEARWQCVEQVVNGLAEHQAEHRQEKDVGKLVRGYLDDLVLDVKEAERPKDDKPTKRLLRLMTLHAAKGLEFDNVWMVGLEEGILPHHRSLADGLNAIAEERRLAYVGVTRARKRLVLSMCLTRMKWGKSRPCRPSRFLYELTGQADKFSEEPPQPKNAPPRPGAKRSQRRGRGAR